MTDKIQIYVMFCEDFRVDIDLKPIITGILSPVIYTDDSPMDRVDKVTLVTAVTIPASKGKVELKLKLQTENTGEEKSERTLSRTVERPDDLSSDEPWMTFVNHEIYIKEWNDNTRIFAEVTSENV